MENYEKITDFKVEVYYENGDIDNKFFDTYEESCEAYDNALKDARVVKACRYDADECQESKSRFLQRRKPRGL